MSYQRKFAEEVRLVMSRLHISQATLARLTNLNAGTISRVISGNKKVSYDTVAKIAEKLDMWKGLTPYQLSNKIEELQAKLNYVNNENHKLESILTSCIILIISGVLAWLIF